MDSWRGDSTNGYWHRKEETATPNLLTIPDEDFKTASQLIGTQLGRSGVVVDLDRVEKLLRSYVYLGWNKLISDYPSATDEGVKSDIISQVQKRTQYVYYYPPTYADARNDLDTLTNNAELGLVNLELAYPRRYQEQKESALDTSATDTATKHPGGIISQGIQDFFGVVKSAIESALKGLGIDIPVEVLIGLAVLVFIFLMTRTAHQVNAS